MSIRSTPNTDAYRSGHERIFGSEPRQPAPPRCPECGKSPCDPNYVHPIRRPNGRVDPTSTLEAIAKIVDKVKNGPPPSGVPRVMLQQAEMCAPCNVEHPRGEPCPKCGRSLLLG